MYMTQLTEGDYLNGVERYVVHVMDHTHKAMTVSNEGASKKQEEVVLIQAHLRGTTKTRGSKS